MFVQPSLWQQEAGLQETSRALRQRRPWGSVKRARCVLLRLGPPAWIFGFLAGISYPLLLSEMMEAGRGRGGGLSVGARGGWAGAERWG